MQDLDLSLDLLLLDWLKDLDDAFLVVDDVDAFEYLAVLAATYEDRHTSILYSSAGDTFWNIPILRTTS